MKQYLLGIDIGTSACKIAVFNLEGKALASGNGPYKVYYNNPGWAEQNPDEWWAAVCRTVKLVIEKAQIRPEEIAGIGIDGMSWAAIPMAADGSVLMNTPIWMDTRAADICKRTIAEFGEDKLFEISGNAFYPAYTMPKVMWYKEVVPDVYKKSVKILQCNSFIAYRLTGQMTQDISQGYGWACFNIRKGQWDKDLCRDMGVDDSLLPDIYKCHDIIGTVTKEAAQQCGLCEGIPVTAGALDAACGTLGAGVCHPGETQEQGGQAGGMSICIEKYSADPRLILSYHATSNQWILQGGTTGGGGVMRWMEQEFADYERIRGKEVGKSSLDLFNEIAGAVAPGCDGMVFLPYMAGERTPIWDPKAKGVFYGLDFSKTKGHFVRAAMEGVAYALRHNLEVAEQAGAYISELRTVGGSANSLLWTQIKSDITGKKVIVPYSDTAATLGAVMLAGVGTGIYKDFEDAVQKTVKTTRVHEPNPENKVAYDKNFETYLQIYENLKGLMGKE